MATKAPTNKALITHPETGREKKIDAAIYEPFKTAILQSLKGSKGKTFTELAEDVIKMIRKKMPGFTKSIPWYTISIKLDLETKGFVETFSEKGKKMSRLTLKK